jgi:hypothetical protein
VENRDFTVRVVMDPDLGAHEMRPGCGGICKRLPFQATVLSGATTRSSPLRLRHRHERALRVGWLRGEAGVMGWQIDLADEGVGRAIFGFVIKLAQPTLYEIASADGATPSKTSTLQETRRW